MLPTQYTNVLTTIARELNNHNIRWALGGSCLLYLHGMSVTPSDIDIIIDMEDRSKLDDFVKPYFHKAKPASGMYLTERFYTLSMGGIDIDLMVEFQIDTKHGVYRFPFEIERVI